MIDQMKCVNEAAVDILSVSCELALRAAGDDHCLRTEAAIGVISMVGDVEMSIFLGLPRQTAQAVTARFAGFEIPFESEDMADAVGELTNILAGDVKKRLADQGVSANLALPNVLRAENLHVLVQRFAQLRKSCFSTEVGDLWTGVLFADGGTHVA